MDLEGDLHIKLSTLMLRDEVVDAVRVEIDLPEFSILSVDGIN